MITGLQASKFFQEVFNRPMTSQEETETSIKFHCREFLLEVPKLENGHLVVGTNNFLLDTIGPNSNGGWIRRTPGSLLMRFLLDNRRILSRVSGAEAVNDALGNLVKRFTNERGVWIDQDDSGPNLMGKETFAHRVRIEYPPIQPQRGRTMAEVGMQQKSAFAEIAQKNGLSVPATSTSHPGEVFEEAGETGLAKTIEKFVPFAHYLHPRRHAVATSGVRNAVPLLNSEEPIVRAEKAVPGINALTLLAQDSKGENISDMIMVRKGFLPRMDCQHVVRTQVDAPNWVMPIGISFDKNDRLPVGIDRAGNPRFPNIPLSFSKQTTWTVVKHEQNMRGISIHIATRIKLGSGTKITTRHSSKGTINVIPDEEMPKVDILGKTRTVDIVLNPASIEKRGIHSLLLEMMASRIAMESVHIDSRVINGAPLDGFITIPVDATRGWLMGQLKEQDIIPKLAVTVREANRPKIVGDFFVGWVFWMVQPQHPEVVSSLRRDIMLCPQCEKPVNHPLNICLDCWAKARPVAPILPTGLLPDRGRFGVKIIRPYWAFLTGFMGFESIPQELMDQRNPEALELLGQFFEMFGLSRSAPEVTSDTGRIPE